jgi:hypothetical protein
MPDENTNQLTPETFVFPEVETIDTPPHPGLVAIANKAGVMTAKTHYGVETPLDGTGGGSSLPVADTTAVVKGSADATKLLRFEVDGFTTATTRVATPPDEDFTMVGVATTQTLANKIMSQLHLLIGGFKAIFTHAFTADRTVTLPGDANVTLVGADTTQNLSNKTFTDGTMIDGSADEIQLRVQGHSSQTANLVSIEDDSGNVQVSIDGTGGVIINEEGNGQPSTVLRVESDVNTHAFAIEGNTGAIGIGVSPVLGSSDLIVDVVSTDGMFGLPAMTSAQIAALTAVRDGAIAFDTDLKRFVGEADGIAQTLAFDGADGIPFVTPLLASWTALNQTGGQYDDTSNKRLTAQHAGNATFQLRGWYTPLAAPFDYRFYVAHQNSDVSGNGLAIGFRQNSTGELHTVNFFNEATTLTPQYTVWKFNSATSFNSAYVGAKDVTSHYRWIRLLDNNGSARAIYGSSDGTVWEQLHTIGRTDFLTADEIFFGMSLSIASGDDAQAILLSMEDIS